MVDLRFEFPVQALPVLIALLLVYSFVPYLFYFVLCCLAVVSGIGLALLRGSYKIRGANTFSRLPQPETEDLLNRMKLYPKARPQCVLLSANFDSKLQEIIDLTLKHHMIQFYNANIGQDQESYFRSVMPETWSFLQALHVSVSRLDIMKLLTQEAVQCLREHHQTIQAQLAANKCESSFHFQPDLEKFPYLQNPHTELDFLRQLSDVLLCTFLPKNLLNCTATRVLIREYLACQVFQPIIEQICDPDFINRKLLAYLSRREATAKSAQKNYAVATTYQGFMKYLRDCNDAEELKHMRELIITDIMQAKAVHKMKQSRSKGIQDSQFPIPIPAQKAEMLMNRMDLPKYIKQLGLAKEASERLIMKLSGEDYSFLEQSTISQIPFEYIMTNDKGRTCLLQFLEKRHCHLLYCWMIIEDLKSCRENERRDKVIQIFIQFLSPTAESYIDPDTEIVRSVESYLQGNDKDFTALCELQEYLYTEIHGKYYYSFLCSNEYSELKKQVSSEGALMNSMLSVNQFPSGTGNSREDDSQHKKKLKQLRKQREEKTEEMVTLTSEPSAALVQRKKLLEKDLGNLSNEISQIEHYLEHTDQYFGTIGEWIVKVHSVDIEEANSKDPLFILLVQHLESVQDTTHKHHQHHNSSSSDEFEIVGGKSPSTHEKHPSTSPNPENNESLQRMRDGWVVGRRFSEFEELHGKIAPLCKHHLKFPTLKRLSILPSFGDSKRLSILPSFGDSKEQIAKQWNAFREQLQDYMNSVTASPRVMESEYMFNFLSSASDNFRKSNEILESKRSVLGSLLHFGETKPDALVEPFYMLFIELFELENFTGKVRTQLIDLIQFTFGVSINQKIQETVSWMVSEPMLIYYLENYREAMWPGGNICTSTVTRSDEEKAETKQQAKEKLLKNMSIVMQTLISKGKCKVGLIKMFDAFQDGRANKQLFYSIVELFMCALIPEVQEIDV